MLVNCQLVDGAHEGQPGFAENAEFRVHLKPRYARFGLVATSLP
jgi:hypothetical protein